MSLSLKGVALTGALTAAWLLSGPAYAGWLTDSNGAAVTNSVGECWKTGYDNPKTPEKCGGKVAEPEKQPPPKKEGIPPIVLNEGLVHFAFDKANLTPKGKEVLKAAAAKVKPRLDDIQTIKVVGHTDSIGSEKYNQKLSERRAKSVAGQLEKEGIPASKMSVSGMGETKPIADNKTKAGRSKNRRVEIDFVMKP